MKEHFSEEEKETKDKIERSILKERKNLETIKKIIMKEEKRNV